MCYFTKKVLNKRFLPNRKNRWNPPVCTDERFRYVEVECGKTNRTNGFLIGTLGVNPRILQYLKTVVLNFVYCWEESYF